MKGVSLKFLMITLNENSTNSRENVDESDHKRDMMKQSKSNRTILNDQ